MARDGSGLGSCIVVVGGPGSELVQTTMQWARTAEIDAVTCADVYAAVTHLARAAGRRMLVVGTIQELTRENGAFLRLAAARAIPCGCVLDRACSVGRRSWRAALAAGVRLLEAGPEVRGLLQEWLAAPPQRGRGGAAEPSYEELRATEAELSALLE